MAVVGPQSPVEHPVPVLSSWLKSELFERVCQSKRPGIKSMGSASAKEWVLSSNEPTSREGLIYREKTNQQGVWAWWSLLFSGQVHGSSTTFMSLMCKYSTRV